jgi:hypothetical protein
MTTRRHFLGTLGKALGASGLLLPFAGKGALALPADLGKAAQLPVTAAPMPFSTECLELRQMRRQLLDCRLRQSQDRQPHDDYHRDWHAVMDRYGATTAVLAGRPATSWGHVVELAEIAWHFAPKEEIINADGCSVYTGRIATRPHLAKGEDCWRMRANAALIEAVLALGGGERFDHDLEHERRLGRL